MNMEQITVEKVQQVINMKGIAYPYPRKGMISINGGKGVRATQPAIKLAQAYIKQLKNK
jgi:hypothetical protein